MWKMEPPAASSKRMMEVVQSHSAFIASLYTLPVGQAPKIVRTKK